MPRRLTGIPARFVDQGGSAESAGRLREPAAERDALAAEAAPKTAEKKKGTGALRRSGGKRDVVLHKGTAVYELVARVERAQLPAVGERAHPVIERPLLGSVAEGAPHRSTISILVT